MHVLCGAYVVVPCIPTHLVSQVLCLLDFQHALCLPERFGQCPMELDLCSAKEISLSVTNRDFPTMSDQCLAEGFG